MPTQRLAAIAPPFGTPPHNSEDAAEEEEEEEKCVVEGKQTSRDRENIVDVFVFG